MVKEGRKYKRKVQKRKKRISIDDIMKDQCDQKVEKWPRKVGNTRKKCKKERGE